MKIFACACLGIVGLCNVASAAWGLKFEVWNGSAWTSIVHATPGDVIKFRFGAYFDKDSAPIITTADGTGTAQALTRFTGSNQATSFVAGDMFQNVQRTISSGNPVLTQIAGAMIGTTAVTSFGSQLFLADVPFQTYTEIYTGEVKTSTDRTLRLIEIKNKTFGSGNTAGLTFYNSESQSNKQSGAPQSDGPGRADQIALIWLIPTPGSLAPFAFAGVFAARRRRG